MPSKPRKPTTFQITGGSVSEQDSSKLYLLVGEGIAAWTILEANLFIVYTSIAHPRGVPQGISESFHSITGFRNRIGIVNTLVKCHFNDRKYEYICRKWSTIFSKLSKTSELRNKLAHGAIVKINNKITRRVELGWAPYLDLHALVASQVEKKNRKGIPFPEVMSLDQVREIVDKIKKTQGELREFICDDISPLAQQEGLPPLIIQLDNYHDATSDQS